MDGLKGVEVVQKWKFWTFMGRMNIICFMMFLMEKARRSVLSSNGSHFKRLVFGIGKTNRRSVGNFLDFTASNGRRWMTGAHSVQPASCEICGKDVHKWECGPRTFGRSWPLDTAGSHVIGQFENLMEKLWDDANGHKH